MEFNEAFSQWCESHGERPDRKIILLADPCDYWRGCFATNLGRIAPGHPEIVEAGNCREALGIAEALRGRIMMALIDIYMFETPGGGDMLSRTLGLQEEFSRDGLKGGVLAADLRKRVGNSIFNVLMTSQSFGESNAELKVPEDMGVVNAVVDKNTPRAIFEEIANIMAAQAKATSASIHPSPYRYQ